METEEEEVLPQRKKVTKRVVLEESDEEMPQPEVQYKMTDPGTGVKYTDTLNKQSPFQGKYSLRALRE